jgi:hypothetical protein
VRNDRESRLYSAGDLVAQVECAHATTLAVQDREAPRARSKDNDALNLIQPQRFAGAWARRAIGFSQSCEEGRL